MRIDLHIFDGECEQAEVLLRLRRLEAHMEELLMANVETNKALDEIKDLIENVAGDIERLNIEDPATAAKAKALATRLRAVSEIVPEPTAPPPST